MAERLEALARAYFDCWNTHDGAAVGAKFAPDGSLRDWDIAVSGAQAVGDANGGIFKAVPGIAITVEGIVADAAKSSVACEILVHLNDADKTVLKARASCVSERLRRGVWRFGWRGRREALRFTGGWTQSRVSFRAATGRGRHRVRRRQRAHQGAARVQGLRQRCARCAGTRTRLGFVRTEPRALRACAAAPVAATRRPSEAPLRPAACACQDKGQRQRVSGARLTPPRLSRRCSCRITAFTSPRYSRSSHFN